MSRYERNIIVDGFGNDRQERLANATVLVVGAGGLGSAVLHYLTASGVGHIKIVEFDTVSLSNLQRQILYTTPDIGKSKAQAAKDRLSALNPDIKIEVFGERLTENNGCQLLNNCDIVVDCTDNYNSRLLINKLSKQHNIPMVYGTAEEFSGQVSVFNYNGSLGYTDIFGEEFKQKDMVGVISPVVGVIGSLQAVEVVKIITGIGNPLSDRLLVYNRGEFSFILY